MTFLGIALAAVILLATASMLCRVFLFFLRLFLYAVCALFCLGFLLAVLLVFAAR